MASTELTTMSTSSEVVSTLTTKTSSSSLLTTVISTLKSTIVPSTLTTMTSTALRTSYGEINPLLNLCKMQAM